MFSHSLIILALFEVGLKTSSALKTPTPSTETSTQSDIHDQDSSDDSMDSPPFMSDARINLRSLHQNISSYNRLLDETKNDLKTLADEFTMAAEKIESEKNKRGSPYKSKEAVGAYVAGGVCASVGLLLVPFTGFASIAGAGAGITLTILTAVILYFRRIINDVTNQETLADYEKKFLVKSGPIVDRLHRIDADINEFVTMSSMSRAGDEPHQLKRASELSARILSEAVDLKRELSVFSGIVGDIFGDVRKIGSGRDIGSEFMTSIKKSSELCQETISKFEKMREELKKMSDSLGTKYK